MEVAAVIESSADAFGGVALEPEALPDDPEVFEEQLGHSLAAWKSKGFKVVWLRVPVSKVRLVPVAVEAGFSFHHADESEVLLTRRLIKDAVIPPYATHYIGVGGVVVNSARELLVVSERYRRRGRGPSFKLPGGALHPGEHLVDGVIREVFEETGVRTRFEALACLRHWHGYRFGKSDIYFVSRLSPLSLEISMQESEIEECLWMPLEEYLSAESVGQFNKRIVRAAIESRGMAPSALDGHDNYGTHEFFMPSDEKQQIEEGATDG